MADVRKNLGDNKNNTEDKTVLNSDEEPFDQKTGVIPPNSQGEESISGSAPNPESIENQDMLSNAQDVGSQIGENSQNPKELDIAKDIDNAEQSIKES